jgi:hypothetical protein
MLGVGIGERTLNNGQHLDLSCLEDWQLGEIFNQRRNDPDFLETSGHALTPAEVARYSIHNVSTQGGSVADILL